MENWKDWVKKRPVLYAGAKWVKRMFVIHTPKPLDKDKLDKEIQSFSKIGIQKHERVMVSLTSFPARIKEVKYTIYSLLNQTYRPDKVILWLGKEQFPNRERDLPNDLLKLRKNGLTINFVKDIKSYKKLIPALEMKEDALIITVDDDIYYPNFLVERLMHEHTKYPNCIIAFRAHRIHFRKDNQVATYNNWEFEIKKDIQQPRYCNFFTGVGGVLYEPQFLFRDVLREDLFMKYCPSADDIWFHAMAVLNGTKVKIVSGGPYPLRYVNPEEQMKGINTLASYNVERGGNDMQIHNVLKAYPEILTKLLNENATENRGGSVTPKFKVIQPLLGNPSTYQMAA